MDCQKYFSACTGMATVKGKVGPSYSLTVCWVNTDDSGDVFIGDMIDRSANDKADISFRHCMKYSQHISVPFTVPGKIQLSTAVRTSDLRNTVIVIAVILHF
jgi:hypothetical protein